MRNSNFLYPYRHKFYLLRYGIYSKDAVRSFLFFCLATLLPLMFTICWLFKNTQLPVGDAANYLSTSIDIYHSFKEFGFWNGLSSCYFLRGWRPIVFPITAVPFLFLTNGNLLLSYTCVGTLSILLSVIYIFLLFRLELNRFQAIIATNIIGLLPIIQAQVLGFYAESLLFPCILGAIYHLIKSNYLCKFSHSMAFILLLSFATMLRPVETVTHFIFILMVFFLLGLRKKIFNGQQIISWFTHAFTALLIFFSFILYTVFSNKMSENLDANMLRIINYLFLIVAMITTILWVSRVIYNRKQQLVITNNYFYNESLLISAFFLFFLLVLSWFVPFSLETFEWIYQTSIGGVAANTTPYVGSSHNFWKELNSQVTAEGTIIVINLTLLFLFSLIFCIKEKFKLLTSITFIYLFLLIPLPFLEVFTTVQDAYRKLSTAFPALLMCFLIVGLSQGKLYSLRVLIASITLLIECILLYCVAFSGISFNNILNRLQGYYVVHPVTINPNPHDVVRDFLGVEASKYKLKVIALDVNPETFEPVDPFLMAVMVKALPNHLVVNYPYFEKYSLQNTFILSKKVDAVFIADRIDRMKISPQSTDYYFKKYNQELNSSLKTMYELLYFYSRNDLEKIGWHLGPCLMLKSACLNNSIQSGMRNSGCFGCLLFPLNSMQSKQYHPA